jgi:hypothetical protein
MYMTIRYTKFSGGEISVPANPSPSTIRRDWMDMIENGVLLIGEPCSPYTVTRYISKSGNIAKEKVDISGRKVSLKDLRQRLLKKQEQFMRLQTCNELSQKGVDELAAILRSTNYHITSTLSSNEMKQIIISQQRQRSLAMWHDHATILRNGFIMITVHIVYDKAVFFTNEEYFNKTGIRLNVQCEVEQPEIYMLVLGSSSVEDQAAVISDRVECLSDLSTPLLTTNGKHSITVPVSSQLKFKE